jgi:uncharacterized protein
MIVAVLDTNVLASGIVGSSNEGSVPGCLLRAWRRADFTLALSEHILTNELPRTLAKPYFRARISAEDVQALLTLFREYAVIVEPAEGIEGVASHPEDDVVLATAVSADATHLVTGDAGLLRLGRFDDVTILSPRVFLILLEEESLNRPA